MGTYEELKNAIAAVIKNNNQGEITGDLLQETLLSMVNNLGQYATFVGVATPETNPGTPDQKVFYIAAEKGTYVNFNAIEVEENQLVILINSTGEWSKHVITSISGGGTSGGGLKYSEERILYVSYDGEELTEEQKAYNVETYNKMLEGHPITINYSGMFLAMAGETEEGGIYLSIVVAIPILTTIMPMPIILILNNDGTTSFYEVQTISSDILYVPIVGGELGESEKQNNIQVATTTSVKRIRMVPEPGSVYLLDSMPIGVDVGNILLFFRYETMYKATVDFTTGDVAIEVVGTLNTPN